MFYPSIGSASAPLIVTTRASILSAIDPQMRFSIKGTDGSYVKYGLDPQEAYLKVGGKARGSSIYGVEDEAIWGEIHTPVSAGGEALRPKEK